MTGTSFPVSGNSQVLAEEPSAPAVPGMPGASDWEDPPRAALSAVVPVLTVDGFSGPLDWLVEMAPARKLDLAPLSILALIEAFAAAMEAAFAQRPLGDPGEVAGSERAGAAAPLVSDLMRWAGWTVLAAQLTELRSNLLLPAESPTARSAEAEAETLRRTLLTRAAVSAAADWLERQPQLVQEIFARGAPEAGRGGRADSSLSVTPEAGCRVVGDITELLRACLVACDCHQG